MIFLIRLPKRQGACDMKREGSITVISAMTFLLVASFLFALLEAGRQYQLMTYADMTTSLAIESVCAEYQPQLWKEYHLLALDGAYGGKSFSMEHVTGVLGARVRANLAQEGAGSRLLELELTQMQPTDYRLLTDGDGKVFLHQAASCMQQNLPLELAQGFYERYIQEKSVEEEGVQTDDNVAHAQTAIEEAAAQQREGEEEERPQGPEDVGENPLELVLAVKQNFLLGMVADNVETLSTAAIAPSQMLEARQCQTGTAGTEQEIGWYEKILDLEYLDSYFGNYVEPKAEHALAYEMEYILCGRESDRDNLESVAGRLLLTREAANVAHILLDAEKMGLVTAMAGALAGFTGNPAIIKLVELGIIAAWAYVESILDLRALLAGKRVMLLKSNEQWMTRLGNLVQVFTGELQAKDCEEGLSYQDYLKGFLFFMKERTFAYRTMGIMEQNIRRIPLYQNCRMDHLLSSISYQTVYTAKPLFWDLSILQQPKLSGMQFEVAKSFSYD